MPTDVALREIRYGRVWRANACRVVEERDDLVVLWSPPGIARIIPVDAHGAEIRIPRSEWELGERLTVLDSKGFAGREFERAVAELGATVLRPSRADEHERVTPPLGPLRQRTESIVQTLKDGLRLERHLARSPQGLCVRILARIVALSAAIHLNWPLGRPPRGLAVYA